MLRVLLTLSIVLSSGCGLVPRRGRTTYKDVCQSWIGKQYSELVLNWGPPSSVLDMPGDQRLLTWDVDGGQSSSAYIIGSVAFGSSRRWWCRTSFFVDRFGTVYRASWQGNACR